MSDSKKVMLIGWDAADWKVIHKLMDEDKMPTLQKLIETGVMGNMATLFPSLSPMLWTSIATGKRPYKHGIYGFSEPTPDGNSVQPMTNMSRRSKAIWNILNQHGKKSIVTGWWPSNPAEPINGVMVSDFFHKSPRRPGDPWNLMKNCVHPESMLKELAQLRIHPSALRPEHVLPFVPNAADLDQETDSRLASVMKVLCECVAIHRASSYLLQTQEWDFAAIYYDAIDHFCHGFMRFHPPQQAHVSDADFAMFSNVVNAGYIYHDTMLAKLLEVAGEDVTVILMSDHGFHPDHLRPQGIPTEPAGPAIEHRDYGIFVANGPGIKKDHVVHGAGLLDVAPTILTMYGLPMGEDMDGRPLTDIFVDTPKIESIPTWEDVEGDDGQHPKDAEYDASASKEAMEQLIALGYIDRPDEDGSVATAQCQRELDYNLARAYMDGGLFGEAIPLLLALYNDFPLEFRFGLQLSNCLKAMDRIEDLKRLLDDLNSRWRIASVAARKKIGDIATLAKERRNLWREMRKIDKANQDKGQPTSRLARVNARGKPILFNDSEMTEIRKVRAVARGNPQILDFLSATIAASQGEFEKALDLLEKATSVNARNPGLYFQLGNAYLGLDRLDDAERAFEKALEVDEFHPNALMGLCRTYLEMQRYKKALDFGQQAVALNFQFPLAHFFLGNARKLTGDVSGAIESYQRALEQNPNFAEAHKRLAAIYSKDAFDENLAKEHDHAMRELQSSQEEYLEETLGLELKAADDLDFESILPTIGGENNAQFLRCLAQPRIAEGKLGLPPEARDSSVFVVTGLPRSGTSMMMQMLTAGGIEPYSDGRREADESNPKGYFEADKVKKLAHVNNWIPESLNRVVKVVAPLIQYLPQGFNYHVVMMIRDVEEILESQEKMLERLDRPGGNLTADRFGEVFEQQLQTARNMLKLHNIPCIEIPYREAIASPAEIATKICEFMPMDMDLEAMKKAVEPKLYRQKHENVAKS